MKKKKISLKKEIITNLRFEEMNSLRGGGGKTDSNCYLCDINPAKK